MQPKLCPVAVTPLCGSLPGMTTPPLAKTDSFVARKVGKLQTLDSFSEAHSQLHQFARLISRVSGSSRFAHRCALGPTLQPHTRRRWKLCLRAGGAGVHARSVGGAAEGGLLYKDLLAHLRERTHSKSPPQVEPTYTNQWLLRKRAEGELLSGPPDQSATSKPRSRGVHRVCNVAQRSSIA